MSPAGGSSRAQARQRRLLGDPAIIQRPATRPTDLRRPSQSFPISLNTTLKPFDDINVRKAVIAAFDRHALLLSRGGSVQGTPAWGYLMPGIPGFPESGGLTPPKQFDYLQNFNGDLALAKSYLRKAGYPSGRYTGSAHPLEVGIQGGLPQRAAEITQAQLAKLGIHVKLRLTTDDAYLTKFCGVPKAEVAVCPSTSWGKDFPDGQTLLQPTFAGDAIAVLQRQRLDARRPTGQRCDRRGRGHPARPARARRGARSTIWSPREAARRCPSSGTRCRTSSRGMSPGS
jgi:ABC-type transport system substrate-binding protein